MRVNVCVCVGLCVCVCMRVNVCVCVCRCVCVCVPAPIGKCRDCAFPGGRGHGSKSALVERARHDPDVNQCRCKAEIQTLAKKRS